MKNTTLGGINSSLEEAENQISDLEDKVAENTQSEQQKEKRINIKKKDGRLRGLWYNIKHTNICILGVPEGEEREEGIENLFEEIMTDNFPNLAEEIDTQLQEAQSHK